MLGINEQVSSLHEALGEAGQQISLKAVENVLGEITRRHPDIDAEAFASIRDQVRDTMLLNVEFAGKDGFGLIVVVDLEDTGALHKEEIPDELNVPRSAVEKLRGICAHKDSLEVVAYIILNSTSASDLTDKIGAAHFSAGDTQLLMPIFHTLMDQDASVRDRLLDAVSNLEAYKILSGISGAVDKYFFDRENAQPFLSLTLEHEDLISANARAELHQKHVMAMLTILKEHLQT